MQGLVKTPTRIKKFVPHSDGNSPDLKQTRVSRTIPMLKPKPLTSWRTMRVTFCPR